MSNPMPAGDFEIELGRLVDAWVERIGLDAVLEGLNLQAQLLEQREDDAGASAPE